MGKSSLKYILCTVIWFVTASAQALTLSNIELRSFLNQNIDARIVVSGISAAELEGVEISFKEIATGAARATDYLRAEMVSDTTGQYIQISSKEAVREPVLTFTIEIASSTGKLQREYTLLIDPKN